MRFPLDIDKVIMVGAAGLWLEMQKRRKSIPEEIRRSRRVWLRYERQQQVFRLVAGEMISSST